MYPPNVGSFWTYSFTSLLINITSNHPQTLKISITSPQGTTLLLSAFNGAGGSNYTNCNFDYFTSTNITTGSAPFTNNWAPQGGPLSTFDWENADGIWTIEIIDTLCAGGGGGGGGGVPTPGFFNGGSGASGGFTFTPSSPPPPPCMNWIPYGNQNICVGDVFDLEGWYASSNPWMNYTFYLNGLSVSNPTSISVAGTYDIYAYDPWDGCTYYAYFIINVYSLSLGPDLTATQSCNSGFTNLSTLIPVPGLSTNWTLNGNPISTATANNASAAGIYQAIATNSVGCSDTINITLSTTNGLSLGNDQIINLCAGNPVDLTTLYTTTGLTATWYLNNNPVANPTAISSSGNYSLIASNSSGCSDTAIASITFQAAPNLGTDLTVTACANGTYDLTTLFNTSGFTSNWTSNGNPVPNPLAVSGSALYTLIAGNGSTCTDTANVLLTLNPIPSLGNNVASSICDNSSIDLTTLINAGSNIYTWHNNGNIVINPTAINIAGTYTIIASTSAGCTDTADVILSTLSSPQLGSDLIVNECISSTYDLTALFPATFNTSNWTINGLPVNNPTTISTNGNYTFIATNNNGCSDTANVSVSLSQNPSLGNNITVNTCNNAPLNLSNYFNFGLNTATWYYGGNIIAPPVSANLAGTYTLIATSNAGCSDTAEILMSVNLAPSLGSDQQLSICTNNSIDLTTLYNTSGNLTSYTFNGSQVNNPYSISAAGVYTTICTNSNNCTDTVLTTITQLTTPSLGIDITTSICDNQTFDLTTAFSSAGNTNVWTLNGTNIVLPTSVNTNGIYQLIATSGSGCSDTANLSLTVNNSPLIGSPVQIQLCSGEDIDLTTVFNLNGNTGTWYQNGTTLSNTTVNQAGSYDIVVSSLAGCTATSSASIVVNALPSLGNDQTATNCDGSIIDLNTFFPVSGLTYDWYTNGSTVTDPSNITTAGTYEIIATNNSGCSDTANISIQFNPAPPIGNDTSYALCPWQTLDLSQVYNTSGYSTTYLLNNTPVSQYTAVHDSGNYQVIITDNNACTNTAIVAISNVVCRCDADFEYTARCIQDPIQFELKADSVLVTAKWNFSTAGVPENNQENPIVEFKKPGTHKITLIAELSCGTVVVEKDIETIDCADSCHLWFPSAFTPNNDGLNDVLNFQSDCSPEQYSIEIYNRFGQRIFYTDDPTKSWNGKSNESILSGIYIYRLQYKLPYQDKLTETGKIQLIN